MKHKIIANAMSGIGYTPAQVMAHVKRERAVCELACVVNKPVKEISELTQGWPMHKLRQAYERAARGENWTGI
jgi:hypothetical protein